MANDNPDADAANEERVLSALRDLCAASSRQSKPGIQAVSTLDHLEITLRFDNDTSAKGSLGQNIVVDRNLLRKMAGLVAASAC